MGARLGFVQERRISPFPLLSLVTGDRWSPTRNVSDDRPEGLTLVRLGDTGRIAVGTESL
jgi:hypothetical protein